MKAGSLFYYPGKNYWWPAKTVPLRESSVRLLFPTILFIVYIPTIFFLRYRIEITQDKKSKQGFTTQLINRPIQSLQWYFIMSHANYFTRVANVTINITDIC